MGDAGTALAVVAWPAVRRERMFVNWHYWWQANLINCTVDAAERNPTARRRRRLARLIRGHRFRNISGWTNNYYDDMAWLALALERAQRMQLIDSRKALSTLESQLFDAWSPDSGGGIPWRKNSDFFNTRRTGRPDWYSPGSAGCGGRRRSRTGSTRRSAIRRRD